MSLSLAVSSLASSFTSTVTSILPAVTSITGLTLTYTGVATSAPPSPSLLTTTYLVVLPTFGPNYPPYTYTVIEIFPAEPTPPTGFPPLRPPPWSPSPPPGSDPNAPWPPPPPPGWNPYLPWPPRPSFLPPTPSASPSLSPLASPSARPTTAPSSSTVAEPSPSTTPLGPIPPPPPMQPEPDFPDFDDYSDEWLGPPILVPPPGLDDPRHPGWPLSGLYDADEADEEDTCSLTIASVSPEPTSRIKIRGARSVPQPQAESLKSPSADVGILERDAASEMPANVYTAQLPNGVLYSPSAASVAGHSGLLKHFLSFAFVVMIFSFM